jgi:hypothetical protein
MALRGWVRCARCSRSIAAHHELFLHIDCQRPAPEPTPEQAELRAAAAAHEARLAQFTQEMRAEPVQKRMPFYRWWR